MSTSTTFRLQPGDAVLPLLLPALDGREFDLGSLAGRPYLLAFFRFAGCPFCNLRLHELVTRLSELGPDFGIVAVFDSPLDNLRRHTERHQAPFPVLADADNVHYRAYRVEHSLAGVLRGIITRLPALLRAMLVHGFVPRRIQGSPTTMPLDLLVDRHGIIRVAHYGRDEGDHLPIEQIIAFATSQSSLPQGQAREAGAVHKA